MVVEFHTDLIYSSSLWSCFFVNSPCASCADVLTVKLFVQVQGALVYGRLRCRKCFLEVLHGDPRSINIFSQCYKSSLSAHSFNISPSKSF